MCTVAWMKRAVPEKTKAAVMGVCTTLVTAFACLTIFVVTETALDIRQVCILPEQGNTSSTIKVTKTHTGRAAYCLTQAVNSYSEARVLRQSGPYEYVCTIGFTCIHGDH